ncbi:MAG: pirin family protein [Kiloniellales bacterium]
MSWQEAERPVCEEAPACEPVERVIRPRARDIGGFEVKRALPEAEQRSVGPFVFFDQMGRAELAPGNGIDVRPHPHIGLSTITWLFEGEILHRDSLGSLQAIRPGEVNWMTAGRGIVHSERSPEIARRNGGPLFGIQAWLALPKAHEEIEPNFAHHDAEELPTIAEPGSRLVLIAGRGWGREAPVEVFSDTLYAEARLASGASLTLPAAAPQRALYLLSGAIEIAGTRFAPGEMIVLKPGHEVVLRAQSETLAMVLGGAPLDGPRHLWWNFVSSSKDRIERAKSDWKEGRFPPVPGDDDFIPLPER